MTSLEELKRKAEAATPGEWRVSPDGSPEYGEDQQIISDEGIVVCKAEWGRDTPEGQADYEYIAAANPAAILSLIQRVREAEAKAASARAEALEEAVKVADAHEQSADGKFNGVIKASRKGEKNLELAGAASAGMSHTARRIAQAIRALNDAPQSTAIERAGGI